MVENIYLGVREVLPIFRFLSICCRKFRVFYDRVINRLTSSPSNVNSIDSMLKSPLMPEPADLSNASSSIPFQRVWGYWASEIALKLGSLCC